MANKRTPTESFNNPEMAQRGRNRRVELGITPTEMCSVLGIGTTRLSQMETRGVDRLSKAEQWANALGLDPQDLVFGNPELDARLITQKGK